MLFRQTSCQVSVSVATSDLDALDGVALRAEPNPAPGATRLTLSIGTPGEQAVTVSLFDVRGSLVRTLYEGAAADAPESVFWDGRDAAGQHVAAGVYLARIHSGEQRYESKVLMIR